MIGQISFDMKVLGKRSAGNLHATFDVAGAGNGKDGNNYMGAKLETTDTNKLSLHFTAPVLDPTLGESRLVTAVTYPAKIKSSFKHFLTLL